MIRQRDFAWLFALIIGSGHVPPYVSHGWHIALQGAVINHADGSKMRQLCEYYKHITILCFVVRDVLALYYQCAKTLLGTLHTRILIIISL